LGFATDRGSGEDFLPDWNMNRTTPGDSAGGGLDAVSAGPETVSGMVTSLLFWFSLLAAAFLFALVGLSPKLLEQARLRDEHAAIQLRLVQLEQQNEQLQGVVDAIRQDKDFAAELTRIEFDAIGRDEEIIPVDAHLRLAPRNLELPRTPAQIPRAWYRPLLIPFVENDALRSRLLIVAAVLVVISFTWLQPSSARKLDQPVGTCWSVWQSIRARYIRSA
jgi:hypothetical protein